MPCSILDIVGEFVPVEAILCDCPIWVNTWVHPYEFANGSILSDSGQQLIEVEKRDAGYLAGGRFVP